ncbi:FKBP-type peptidyl-prolyl cis-trans isomerase [Mucilaginibacter sp. UYCu711]|uniref:FKBP-type peptidyl-prolyl cis-trans isomerase n=1 Tax=Mucilaginibacter sp. UYCu711 TaxID=3156339 RepID=UPI003D1ACFA4
MKRYFILVTLLIVGLSSCQKYTVSGLATTQASTDDAKIQAYIAANKLTFTKDASGIYYQIVTPGTTPHPTTSSSVKVTYTSMYLSSVSVGKLDGYTAQLSSHVKALQIAIAKIGTGGRILVIAPSGLVYGSVASGDVPPNSVLYYTVDLNGFSN